MTHDNQPNKAPMIIPKGEVMSAVAALPTSP